MKKLINYCKNVLGACSAKEYISDRKYYIILEIVIITESKATKVGFRLIIYLLLFRSS